MAERDTSSYSVPGVMHDMTVMSTPLPQATSTASKWNSIEDLRFEEKTGMSIDKFNEELDLAKKGFVKNSKDFLRIANEIKVPISDESKKYLDDLKSRIEKMNRTGDFEFVVPPVPEKYLEKKVSNNYLGKEIEKSSNIVKPYSKSISKEELEHFQGSKANKSYFNDLPEKQSKYSSKHETTVGQDIVKSKTGSVCSSANSSLGIIPSDELEEVSDYIYSLEQKLDLSQRLAQKLSLDTSQLDESNPDISKLLANQMKETLKTRKGDNKENKYSLSDVGLIPGYSSDDFSKNNTAKNISRWSSSSIGSSSSHSKNPLSELNSAPLKDSLFRKSSSSRFSKGRHSMSSNPFRDCSGVSVGSEDFQPAEDVVSRLENDEEAWRKEFDFGEKRSLSGIYGDANISTGSRQEKLSISSYMRSKSGPLGCLDNVDSDTQRPQFGLPAASPEKKAKARPILPPPKDKLTFVVEEAPTKETTPWDPQSLIEQYSLLHGQKESDVSVPSLSTIGQMLDKMQSDGISPREMLDKVMESTRTKETKSFNKQSSIVSSHGSQTEKRKNISSVVEGNNSFCRGYESDRSTRYSSSFNSHLSLDDESLQEEASANPNHSVNTVDVSLGSSCPLNYSEFDPTDVGDIVCVMTPESMDFDIFNEYQGPQNYVITYSCYMDGKRNNSAAVVHLPVTRLSLQPGDMKTITVTVIALIFGVIKVKINVVRTDPVSHQSESNVVLCQLRVEVPKISLLSEPKMHMKPILDPEFRGQFIGTIQLKNNGLSSVPVKFLLRQAEYQDLEIYHFGLNKNETTVETVEPGQTFEQEIYCDTPSVFETEEDELANLKDTIYPARAQINVVLASPLKIQQFSLLKIQCKAPLKWNFFNAPTSVTVPSDKPALLQLYSTERLPVRLETVISRGYSVDPETFVIHPRQTMSLCINSTVSYQDRNNILTIHSKDTTQRKGMWNHTVNVRLNSVTPSCSLNTTLATPLNSRPTSPTTPHSMGSIDNIGGRLLKLACTHKELVWGGCTLQQQAIRTCSLKNKNTFREKLRLKISDEHNCFKILNEKKTLETEFKLSLQPMENRQISIVVMPGSSGPKWGSLIISRINSPSDKKVLPLYAFGGKAKVHIEGILQDPEQHMWLYLDSESLNSSFVLTNEGDYSAFFKISEGNSAATVGGGLSIAPPEQILPPGSSETVIISLSVTPERLEYLLSSSSQTAICITRLTVTHGDESTRLRLSRLSRVNPILAQKLSTLNQLVPASSVPDIEKLGDPSTCAETLWLEDVSEWTVGVLVKRSALEALRLDTSVEFVDLATTIIN